MTAPLLVRALRRERVERTPVWYMRQAGRCLAEYRALREKYGILEIAREPELCARVTRMPVDRLEVDAAVLYADIMLPLDGMGVPFHIQPDLGPIVARPVRAMADVAALRVVPAEEATPYLFETIRALRRDLPSEIALIGFDALPEALARVKDGSLTATVEQFPGLQSSKAVDKLVAFLKDGTKPEPKVELLTPITITKDNLDKAERLGEIQ